MSDTVKAAVELIESAIAEARNPAGPEVTRQKEGDFYSFTTPGRVQRTPTPPRELALTTK